MLSEKEVKAIEAEGEKIFPVITSTIRDIQTESGFVRVDNNERNRKIAIEIIKLERIKAKKLLEALELISKGYPSRASIMIATKAINEYNKT